jgi:hypothetical protein
LTQYGSTHEPCKPQNGSHGDSDKDDKDQGNDKGDGRLELCRVCACRTPLMDTLVISVTDVVRLGLTSGDEIPGVYAFAIDPEPEGPPLASSADLQLRIFAVNFTEETFPSPNDPEKGMSYLVRVIPANDHDRENAIDGGTIMAMIQLGTVSELYRLTEVSLDLLDDADNDIDMDLDDSQGTGAAATQEPMTDSSEF